MPRSPAWSSEEDALLRKAWPAGVRVAEISAMLGGTRTVHAITFRARAFGLSRPEGWSAGGRGGAWCDADNAILREMYPAGVPLEDIADALSRTVSDEAIRMKAYHMGLTRPPEAKGKPGRPPVPERPRFEFTDEDPAPDQPARQPRYFREIETRRIRQFLARGDTLADIARQMRCGVQDIERIAGSADELPRGDCGGAGARPRQPKTRTTNVAPRYNFFRESIL